MDNRPEQKYSAGGICASVWKNSQNKDGVAFDTHSVTFEKRYKDKSGNWKSTASLQSGDIPKAMMVLSKAYEYITLRGDKPGAQPVEA